MLKQRRLTAWLRTKKGEPPAKRGRQPQDTESDAEAMSDSSATLDSTSLSSSSNARAHEELLRPRDAIAE